MPADGTFFLVYAFVASDGFAGFTAYEVATETGLIINDFYATCTLGVGVSLVERGGNQPE